MRMTMTMEIHLTTGPSDQSELQFTNSTFSLYFNRTGSHCVSSRTGKAKDYFSTNHLSFGNHFSSLHSTNIRSRLGSINQFLRTNILIHNVVFRSIYFSGLHQNLRSPYQLLCPLSLLFQKRCHHKCASHKLWQGALANCYKLLSRFYS